MTKSACHVFRELLVEYADGDLSSAEARRVADHMAQCPDCRHELQQLQRSLELARQVWRQSAEVVPNDRVHDSANAAAGVLATTCETSAAAAGNVASRRTSRRTELAFAAVAACAAVVLLAIGLAMFARFGPAVEGLDVTLDGTPAGSLGSSVEKTVEQVEIADGSFEEVERWITREAQVARLAAAARILAAEPELEGYSRKAGEYLVAAYGRKLEDPSQAGEK